MRQGVIQLVVGLVAFVAANLLSDWVAREDRELQRTGRTTAGEVSDLRPAKGGHNVDVEFRLAAEDRDLTIFVSDRDARQYTVGEDVTVVIDRNDPDRVTLRGEDNHPSVYNLLVLMGFLGGPFFALVGLVTCIYHLAVRSRSARPQEPWDGNLAR